MKYCLLFTLLTLTTLHTEASERINTPSDTIISSANKKDAKKYVKQASKLFDAFKTKDALIKYREALVKNPKNQEALLGISKCHYAMSNFGLAMKYAYEAKQINANTSDYRAALLLGRTYHRMGNIDSALIHLTSVKGKMTASVFKYSGIEKEMNECLYAQMLLSSNMHSTKKPLKNLNSGYGDYCPILTNNGKTIYFTSRRSSTKGGNLNPDDQEYFEDSYVSNWNDTLQNWGEPTNELGGINSDGFDAISFIAKDGKTALITINTTAVKSKISTESSDIFTASLIEKNTWGNPKKIDNKSINSSYFDGSATMTDDGNTMYFVSDRKGDESSTDIYMVTKTGNTWGEAKALPFTINTTGRETTPFISGDGRFLFFSSDGHLGMGGLDIFVVENKGSAWGTPVNMGILCNTVNNDTHFQYYPELHKAVMASFELVGQKASLDLFEVDMTTFSFPQGN